LIHPIFAPIGFTWEICIALIPAMAAREVIIAALGVIYAMSGDEDVTKLYYLKYQVLMDGD
jgi:ferrous iron transport protein B